MPGIHTGRWVYLLFMSVTNHSFRARTGQICIPRRHLSKWGGPVDVHWNLGKRYVPHYPEDSTVRGQLVL